MGREKGGNESFHVPFSPTVSCINYGFTVTKLWNGKHMGILISHAHGNGK